MSQMIKMVQAHVKYCTESIGEYNVRTGDAERKIIDWEQWATQLYLTKEEALQHGREMIPDNALEESKWVGFDTRFIELPESEEA